MAAWQLFAFALGGWLLRAGHSAFFSIAGITSVGVLNSLVSTRGARSLARRARGAPSNGLPRSLAVRLAVVPLSTLAAAIGAWIRGSGG